MYHAVNAKIKNKPAVISDEYASMLKNLGMESLWDIARAFTGTFNFHCIKPTQQQGNVKENHFKADESFVINFVTVISGSFNRRRCPKNLCNR